MYKKGKLGFYPLLEVLVLKRTILILFFACSLLLAFIPVYAEESFCSGGRGTSEDPYWICTTDDLQSIIKKPDCYYVQMANINCSSIENFSPIGNNENPFCGVYNGNGFLLKNINIVADNTMYLGIFGYSQGTIENITIENIKIEADSKESTIYSGSIVGYNEGIIRNCSSNANIVISTKGDKLNAFAGGICGASSFSSSIQDCSFDGNVSSTVNYTNSIAYSAGICASYSIGSITNSSNKGEIIAIGFSTCDAYAGGIVALGDGTNCINVGNVSAVNAQNAYAGGISGKGSPRSCNNTGEIFASTKYGYYETYCGGISGYGSPSYCINYGLVSAFSSSCHVRVGGIVGQGSATDCRNYGNVNGESTTYESSVGGVTGRSYYGTIKRCSNYGKITMADNGLYSCGMPGGVTGELQYSQCIQCCNFGDIEITGSHYVCFVGGVAGGCNGTIIDCFNCGSIILNYSIPTSYSSLISHAGGVFSGNQTSCLYCYNIGSIVTASNLHELGGIHANNGEESNTIEYCYAINTYGDPLATEINSENGTLQETFVGFDFDDVWAISPEINNGYPHLKTLPDDGNSNWFYYNPKIGDINADMEITEADCVILARHIAKIECLADTTLADVNGDGEVNAKDLTALARLLKQ